MIFLVLTAETTPDFVNIIPAFLRSRISDRPNLVKIIDNMGWLFFDKVLRMGLGFLLGVWVARYLGPDLFGLFSYASALVGMFSAVAGLGLQSIVVREIVRNTSSKEEILGTAAVLQLLSGLIAYACVLSTILWLRAEDTLASILVAILGSIMLFRFSDVALYWFESQVLSKYVVWVQNGCFVIFAAIKVGLILRNAPLLAFAWATVAEALVVSVLILIILGLRGTKLRELKFSMLRAKSLLTSSWPLFFSGIAITVNMKIDQIMLGQMLGNDAVGIYSVAVRISEVWYFVTAIMMASIFPKLASLDAEKSDLLHRRLSQAYGFMFWISVAVALALSFSSSMLINLLFGARYADAADVVVVYAWAGISVAIGCVWSSWILLEDKSLLGLAAQLLAALLNIALNLILIPIYGINGSAVATLIAYSISGMASWFLYKPNVVLKQLFYGIFFWGK